MSLALHVQRAFTVTSPHNSLLTAAVRSDERKRIAQRLTRNTATLSYTHDDASSPFDMHIFDIFDAPSRLGESSKLLRAKENASSPHSSASAARSIHSSARTERPFRTIKPLPAPILFEGPARPKRMSMTAYRAPARRVQEANTLPLPLPAPVMFDGPSRLRPYARSGASSRTSAGNASSASPSQFALLVGATGLALYAGSEYYKTELEPSR
ncbi:hypothetical protein EUX98_g3703 [Antrodiella citrinella]|uniref:Uncharacterized protein n=1 Tax=Antrodiella citrinella TaxID=2447956 RepID=A0A4S4MWZ1_9APHY|nr:hypothetical protein EUX98_g3703 [Antrodiella citrinella]